MPPCPDCAQEVTAGFTYCPFCQAFFHDGMPWWDDVNRKARTKLDKQFTKQKGKLDKQKSKGKLADGSYHMELNELMTRFGIHSKLLHKYP
jgi:hypothetical protein